MPRVKGGKTSRARRKRVLARTKGFWGGRKNRLRGAQETLKRAFAYAFRDPQLLVRAVTHPSAGGIDVFVGMVRDHSEGSAVTLLEYEAYASMAEKEMARIAEEIAGEIPGVRLAALHHIEQPVTVEYLARMFEERDEQAELRR